MLQVLPYNKIQNIFHKSSAAGNKGNKIRLSHTPREAAKLVPDSGGEVLPTPDYQTDRQTEV